jgi:hypothetical protein
VGVEDVGVRLVVEGEQQFISAFNQAHTAMDKVDSSQKNLGDTSKKTAQSFGNLKQSVGDALQGLTGFNIASIGVVGALVAVAGGIKASISAASDMNETVSKSEVVFGKSAKAVEEMGNSAAVSMGMSKQASIAAAATYGNLFTSMGMAQEASADMSIGLVRLASDLASFNNIPTDQVLEKLRAGLVGESEPLKSLGININEATLKQEAMNMKLYDGTGELTVIAKAQAAYSLMVKQSTNALGDFERTSDGAANQQRILEAQVKDLEASIGKGLLPVYAGLLKVMNDSIKTVGLLAGGHEKATVVLEDHKKEIVKTSKTYEEYAIEVMRSNAAAHGFEITNDNVRESVKASGKSMEAATTEAGGLTEALWKSEQAMVATTVEVIKFDAAMNTTADDMGGNQQAYLDFIQRMKDLDTATKNAVDMSFKPMTLELLAQTAAAGLTGDAYKKVWSALMPLNDAEFTLWQKLLIANAAFRDGKISVDEYLKVVTDTRDELAKITNEEWVAQFRLEFNLDAVQRYADQANAILRGIKGPTGGWTIPTPSGTVPPTPGNDEGEFGGKMAAGGDFLVKKPTWFLAGDNGPERALFIPQSMAAGPISNNYSTSNNYNLSVMTNQNPAVVQQSYRIMQMLAG